jgi:hypothetical protein
MFFFNFEKLRQQRIRKQSNGQGRFKNNNEEQGQKND